MDTFLDMQEAVQSDLTIGSESTLFTPEVVKLAINRAYRKAGGLFLWPDLEDAKVTSAISGLEYYDYPRNWRPDSVWKLILDGVDYGDPLAFRDYLYETENNFPNWNQKIWSTQGRKYFIRPIPTTEGTDNITVWGFRSVDKLTEDLDITIFSYSQPECNEAIVLEATSILKSKGEDQRSGQFMSQEAKEILAVAWKQVRNNQAKYEKTTPFFDVPDFMSGRLTRDIVKRNIGNF